MFVLRSQDSSYCWGKKYTGKKHIWGANINDVIQQYRIQLPN